MSRYLKKDKKRLKYEREKRRAEEEIVKGMHREGGSIHFDVLFKFILKNIKDEIY